MDKTLFIDRDLLTRLLSNMRGIRYKLGAKAPALNCDSSNIARIDCSGFVRYVLYRITAGAVKMPDGSVNQRDWCLAQDFKQTDYAHCALKDGRLRIAFLDREKRGNAYKAGHVWFVLDGLSIESRGGKGVDRRPWNTRILKDEVDYCFVLTGPG